MSDTERRLRNAIKQSVERGFTNFTIMSSRGDCNCPHPVTYHPKDGHGYEDEKTWLDFNDDGTAIFDDGDDEIDPLEALCQLFESMPEIKERELIT